MAYRFTNTDKWNDSWFSNLKQFEKLLFMYLCDNCDIAGFIEINTNRWSSDLGSSKETILGAIEGLNRGLIVSDSIDCIFIRNFLKHQKNLPLNEKNNAHLGIIKRFEYYKNKFNIENIETFINQDFKPLVRGYGNGKGNGKGNDSSKNTISWKNDFEIYKENVRNGYREIMEDEAWFKKQREFYPNVDILKSIEKSCVNYWITEGGWKNKKKAKTETINWKQTFANAISQPQNKVYYDRNTNNSTTGNTKSGNYSARNDAEERRRSVDNLADLARAILQEP